jgi:CheY-like chemotaxis protein
MILRDITQTRKLQAQLQHAQKMESIGTIASGVAHNFRNILAGVSLQNQLIKVRFQDNLPLLEISDMIANGVKRGARLVDGLMQFSRKQGAKDFSIVNITQVIMDVYDLARKSFDNKINIRVDLPEYLPIIGNHADIGQVIMNLCVNARDAMPDGGVLHIKAHQKREKVEIVVTDTGHGMNKDTVAKCFDPFFTTKEVGKGTGLGLSTSYGIVHDHGGDIHVYSEVGKGTAFKIRLPLSSLEDITIQEGFPEATIQGKGQKVLVVDDETQILKPLEDLLEFLGYQADSETCGTDAIAKYKTWLPDVVLLDRNMPEMDGIACAEIIIHHFPNAKIVLISGYNEIGANGIKPDTKKLIAGYLTKPIDMIELSQLLSKLLDQK